MRSFAVYVCSFLFLVFLTGCSGMNNPFQSTPTTTSSRISSGGEGAASDEMEDEGTVIFNDHLVISSGGLVNPIPSLLEQGMERGGTYDDGDIWPDEVRNPVDEAPEPDAIEDSGGGINPDDVVEDSDDDGLIPEVINDVSSHDDQPSEPDEVIEDDGEIWGEVVD